MHTHALSSCLQYALSPHTSHHTAHLHTNLRSKLTSFMFPIHHHRPHPSISMTTVGYGDIGAHTENITEMVFAMLAMLLGTTM